MQLAAPAAPEEVQQAVVLARDQHRDALGAPGVVQAPLHREALGHLARERPREVLAERVDGEGHAHEEGAALGIGRVLVGGDDVRVARGQEPRDRRDDAGRSGQAMSSRASIVRRLWERDVRLPDAAQCGRQRKLTCSEGRAIGVAHERRQRRHCSA